MNTVVLIGVIWLVIAVPAFLALHHWGDDDRRSRRLQHGVDLPLFVFSFPVFIVLALGGAAALDKIAQRKEKRERERDLECQRNREIRAAFRGW